jgi:glyoxylase-like metal-dependent hydrolase (beta-lactamase superfamily II)
MRTRSIWFLVVLCSVLRAAPAPAQLGDPSKVELKTTPVVGAISVIEGANGFAGGNVAVSVGDDGVLLVDDELQPMSAKLKARVALLTNKPVRFVINTHWHFDHAGGNAAFGGAGALIVAHDNVRKRLSVDTVMEMGGDKKMPIPATPAAGLPVVTFAEDVTLHVNGDDIHIFHVAPAHTDTDAVVHFTKANVIHTGDLYTPTSYPIVDPNSAGRYEGFIEAIKRILAFADDHTRIIPGHGPVGGRAEMVAYHDMLLKMAERVSRLKAAGKTLDQIKAAKPTAEFDAKYGQSFMRPEMMVETIYKTGGTAKPAPRHSK